MVKRSGVPFVHGFRECVGNKMFYIVAGLCWVACVFAAPAPTDVVPLEKQQPTVIPIVSQSEELEPNGTYKFSYETGNGIKREEISYDKVIPKTRSAGSTDSNEGGESGDSDEIHVQQGSYSYTAPDGTLISVRYIADENGFQPIGDHIPRVPAPGSLSSSEKSGRALKSDSDASGSTPAKAEQSARQPETPAEVASTSADIGEKTKIPAENPAEPVPSPASTEASTIEGTTALDTSAESTTGTQKSAEAVTDASTTEAAKTTASEASTTPAVASEAPADASTTETAKTTEVTAASTTPAANGPSTDEGSTTVAAA